MTLHVQCNTADGKAWKLLSTSSALSEEFLTVQIHARIIVVEPVNVNLTLVNKLSHILPADIILINEFHQNYAEFFCVEREIQIPGTFEIPV